MGRLQDKVCIVTGASSGIGAAAAELFAAEGAKVVLAARREDKLNAVAAKIAAKGGEASVVVTDISVRAQADALIAKAVELYGKIDVLWLDGGQVSPEYNHQDPNRDANNDFTDLVDTRI